MASEHLDRNNAAHDKLIVHVHRRAELTMSGRHDGVGIGLGPIPL